MALPFVRDLFADVENLPAFSRVASHLKEGTGRIRVSGLAPAAKALLLVLLQKAAARPLIVIVTDNRAAEELVPVLSAFSELSGGAEPDSIVRLPAHDVLPFENLSPHPDRSGAAGQDAVEDCHGRGVDVVSPVRRRRSAVRRSITPGWRRCCARRRHRYRIAGGPSQQRGLVAEDVVEMPGQYARRGGILDVYSPEADRPVRFEFFGDEIESIRKFDPDTQRSAAPLDEARLLPLTETPVREDVLAAVHARLAGSAWRRRRRVVEAAIAAGGVSVFPGWEFFGPW